MQLSSTLTLLSGSASAQPRRGVVTVVTKTSQTLWAAAGGRGQGRIPQRLSENVRDVLFCPGGMGEAVSWAGRCVEFGTAAARRLAGYYLRGHQHPGPGHGH